MSVTAKAQSSVRRNAGDEVVSGNTNGRLFYNYQYSNNDIAPITDRNMFASKLRILNGEIDDSLTIMTNTDIAFADATGSLDMNGSGLHNVPTSSVLTDAASVEYVQNYLTTYENDGIVKLPVDIAVQSTMASVFAGTTWTTSSGGNAAYFTIPPSAGGTRVTQSVSLVAGTRVLITAETNGKENGIYYVQQAGTTVLATVLVRDGDANTAAKLPQYTVVLARRGSYAGSFFRLNTNIVTLDTTPQSWTMLSGGGGSGSVYTAGQAISITSNQISVAISIESDPGLILDTDDRLKVGGPTRWKAGSYTVHDTDIEARFGTTDPSVIVYDGTQLLVSGEVANRPVTIQTEGSASEIRLNTVMAITPSIVYKRLANGNTCGGSFAYHLQTTSTTYAVMTLDGAAYAGLSQLFRVPARCRGYLKVNIHGIISADTDDVGRGYSGTMTVSFKRAGTTAIDYTDDGISQDPVQTNLILYGGPDPLVSGTWANPRVVPKETGVVPTVDGFKIEVASPDNDTTCQWVADCEVSYVYYTP